MPNKPLERGALVRIKKGTALWSTNPSNRKFVAGKTYVVKIHDSYAGYRDGGVDRQAEVVWAGTHGYWTYASLWDVEVIEPYLLKVGCNHNDIKETFEHENYCGC